MALPGISRGGIVRGWSAEARAANFRNFRFWFVLAFGLICLFFGGLYLLSPLIGSSADLRTLPLALGFGAVLLWIGVSTLTLRASRAYDWAMSIGCLFVGVALLMFVVILVPMYDPSNTQHYGKPSELPLSLFAGMLVAGIAILWLSSWMSEPAKPEAGIADELLVELPRKDPPA